MVVRSTTGRSDTGRGHRCPCGRSHPTQGRARKRRDPVPHGHLSALVYDALAAGKLETADGTHIVRYSGDCQSPIVIPQYASSGALFVSWLTRCRRCVACLKAKQFYWARVAKRWTQYTADQGRRTWFGTLTLTVDAQLDAVIAARADHGSPNAEWWHEANCDERFRLVRKVLVGWCKRYWKRLRKGRKRCERCYPKKPRAEGEWDHPPAKFKFFLVFERHKSGLPHMHWVLHETGDKILKKHLQCEWPYGFTKVLLVKGDDVGRVGFYVSKYLGKAYQARQIASLKYARFDPEGQTANQGEPL